MRIVCVQFQPNLTIVSESRVCQAFREAIPDAEFQFGTDVGRYVNILFDADSPEAAIAKLRPVFDSAEFGHTARDSCIVTCQGERGWTDYRLLHHFDQSVAAQIPPFENTEHRRKQNKRCHR